MISVSTEINDANTKPAHGWILFDGQCPVCLSWVRRTRRILEPCGFAFVPLQTPWVRIHFALPEDQLLSEMRLLLHTGETYGGADAIIALAKYVWWAWPLIALSHISGMRHILRAGYRYIAARRYCANGICGMSLNLADVVRRHEQPRTGL